MAVFGELVLIGIGLLMVFWSVLITIIGSAFSGKFEWVFIPAFVVGILLIYIGIHYGVISVGISK